MSEIESPLGKKSFGQTSRKVMTVSDESEDFDTRPLPPARAAQPQPQMQEVKLTPEQFNAMQARKQDFRVSQKRPTNEARERVEILTGIGRLTQDVVIENYKFSLQSLKSKEMREVIKAVAQTEMGAESAYEMRTQILARSIVRIDDQPISLVLGDDSLEAIMLFLDDSEETVVNKLFDTYNKMVKSNEEKITIKTAEDAQEVAEAVKK